MQDGIVYHNRMTGNPPGSRSRASMSARASHQTGDQTSTPAADLPADGSMTVEDANALQAALRAEMLQSLVSPRRTEPRPLAQTELLTGIVLPHLRQNSLTRALLRQPAAGIIPAGMAKSLSRTFDKPVSEITRQDILSLSTPVLATVTRADEPAINRLKNDLLAKPFRSDLASGSDVAQGTA